MVTLSHPTAYFWNSLPFRRLSGPSATVKKYGRDWTKPGKMVSNGPYVLKEWRFKDYILVEANPYYWRPVPVQRIKVRLNQ